MTGEQRLFNHQMECLRAGRPPLKLTRGQADAQAVRLREAGLSYSAVRVVMALYHGAERSDHAWNTVCRDRGVPASKASNFK